MNTSPRRTLAAMLLLCALPLLWIVAMRFYRPLPEFATLPDDFVDMAHSVAWSRDDQLIAAVGPIINDDGKRQLALRWWKRDDKGNFQTLRTSGLADEGGIVALHFLSAKDEKTPLRLLSLSERGVVRVWNADNGKCENRWMPRNDDGGAIMSVAASLDGQRIACAESVNSVWRENESPSGRLTIRDLSGRVLQAWDEKEGIVRCVAWSHDKDWVAAGSSQGMVTIYEPKTKRQLQRWRVGKKNGWIGAIASNGNTVAPKKVTYERVQKLEFVPNTSLLAMTFKFGANLALRDVISNEALPMNYQMFDGGALTFSYDGRLIAYSGGDIRLQSTLQQTDFNDLQHLQEKNRSQRTGSWTIPNSDTPFVFSPDARQIAARGDDGAIVLWRVN